MPKGEHKTCLVCQSEKLSRLNGFEKHHLCKCGSCGFVFCQPIPTQNELNAVYEGYGRNDYLSELTIQAYERVLDTFEPYRKTNKLIDVGCGIGYFLEVAKRRGWEIYGTEFTEEAVKICEKKGASMQLGVLNPSNYEAESFDVVCSFEVIEHINNPLEELGNFNKLLRKGGLVYCTTPNFNAVERYQLGADWNVLGYPEHLSYYNPKTLKCVFSETGFKTKKVLATGVSITRIKKSQGKSDQATISKTSDDEKLRNQIAGNPLLGLAKDIINWKLTLFGVGNSLKGWFVKE
ncbi:MAG: methyltransferase domain-containing protein [Flavobacteriales bacterium]|nr:methyltransferase domain-containing protein [Flavobacteriales bacterium]MCB9203388.1 methyltransferase domain-containing protein [Flavobacteriales bacterium]